LQEYGGQYPELYGRAESSLLELRDVFQQLQSINDDFSLDEKRLDEVQARLSSIYLLQKKHGLSSVSELIAYQKDLEQRTSNISNLDEKLQDLADSMNEALVKVKENGAELSRARKAAAEELLKEVHEHLADLSMPYSNISAEWKLIEPSANGLDGLTLLFSANKGIAPAELKQVASGGEFSRLMLCIKYSLARRAALPTLIFDEIDSGISGEVGRKVGKMIQDMARYHQVIAITHLPQIASLADAHFFVYKNQEGERTTSMMKLLAEDERVEEIATMMSGSQPSASALAAAKELMVL
jgi:DNA repair protein RecN (Recombination protein N)